MPNIGMEKGCASSNHEIYASEKKTKADQNYEEEEELAEPP